MKEPKKKAVQRFRGLALADDDRRELATKKAGGRLSARHWRRIRILELLDQKWTMQDTADATGTYPREVRRVARRYLARGLEAALTEDPRPKPEKKFDARGEARRRRSDVQPAIARTRTLDGEAARARGRDAGYRRLSRQRNNSTPSWEPRTEAVAGTTCGACPS